MIVGAIGKLWRMTCSKPWRVLLLHQETAWKYVELTARITYFTYQGMIVLGIARDNLANG